MSIIDDNFESYSVGSILPFGGWTATFGNPNLVVIIAGGTEQAASGSTKAVQLNGGSMCKELDPTTHESYDSGVTVYGAFYPTQEKISNGEPLDLFAVENGPDRNFSTWINLVALRVENDCTISAYHGNLSFGPLLLGNSLDTIVRLQTWNFIQLSVSFGIFTDPISHIDFLKIVNLKVWLNGEKIIDESSTVTAQEISKMRGPLPLPNTVARWTQVEFHSNRMIWDNITIESGTSSQGYIHVGTPVDKVFQGVAEIPIEPDSAKINIFQGAVEISELPNSTKLSVFQGVVELILLPTVIQGLWKVREM